jgi:alcohol dehydrogenase class IV
LDATLKKYAAKHIFLVTGNRSYTLSGAEKNINEVLPTRRFKRFMVSSILPDLDEVQRGLESFQQEPFDLILAIGGGAVLDIAKLIGIFSEQNVSPSEITVLGQSLTPRKTPFIAIPTTAGSGAEATHFAVLYVDKTKHSIAHPSIQADTAIVDPDLTISVPPRQAASAGLDALSQGIESYWSVNAIKQSKTFASLAIKLANRSVVPAVTQRDLKACADISHAALLAGQAINISKTTASHALSYTLTAHFNVPHGQAVFLTLGEFMVNNAETTAQDANHPLGAEYVRQTILEICDLLGVPDAKAARNHFQRLAQALGLETRLSALGIIETNFDLIAQNVNPERLANHPRKLSAKTIRSIVEHIA